MNNLLAYHPVTNDLLQKIVDAIRHAGSPYKIILFGSHSHGNASPHSDLDLLIIEDSDLPRCRDTYLPYVVYTPKKILSSGLLQKFKNGHMSQMHLSTQSSKKVKHFMKNHLDLTRGWLQKGDSDLKTSMRMLEGVGRSFVENE